MYIYISDTHIVALSSAIYIYIVFICCVCLCVHRCVCFFHGHVAVRVVIVVALAVVVPASVVDVADNVTLSSILYVHVRYMFEYINYILKV